MISPDEIRDKAKKKYVDYLRSIVQEIPFDEIVIKGNKKSSYTEFQKEITNLIENSKEKKGYGYSIKYQTTRKKEHGIQDMPVEIFFQTETDFLKYLHKEKEVAEFRTNYSLIVSKYPELEEWVIKFPSKVIDNHSEWNDLLKICDYFKSNPNPNLYIRELPIQVHTKFIENNIGIIEELLNILIDLKYIKSNEKDFEKRFNLKYDQPLIRFRILDENISKKYLSGIGDLSIPVNQFEQLKLPIKRVFIVENKMNLLTFPIIDETIAIFGGGAGVVNLKDVQWFREIELWYWGDLDVQGFEILSQFKNHFPNVKSFLMDETTFEKFKNYKGDGVISENSTISNLNAEEWQLYNLLKEYNWRLEQEKIPLEYVKEVIGGLVC